MLPDRQLSPEDRLLFDRLLTILLGNLDGAIDFWSLICLGQLPPDPSGFVRHHCEFLRALVVVMQGLLAGYRETRGTATVQLLDQMMSASARLEQAFLVLARFRTVELEETRAAVVAVREVYADLHDAVQRLGQALGIAVSYWRDRSDEQQRHFQGILNGLFDQFAHEAASDPLATASAAHPR
jgi:hypothetical protein